MLVFWSKATDVQSIACVLMLSLAAWHGNTPARCAGVPLAEHPIDEYDEALLFPIEIDGETHLAMLDSGASHCVVDENLPSVATLKRGERKVQGASGRSSAMSTISGIEIHAAGIALPRTDPIVVYDFRAIREGLGRQVRAVVGMPFFRRCVVRIDHDASSWQVLPISTQPAKGWGRPVQVTYSRAGLPRLRACALGDQPVWWLVDTGAIGCLSMPSPMFDALVEAGRLKVGSRALTYGVHSANHYRNGALSDFALLEHRAIGVPISESGGFKLGLGYLRRFQVTIDLANDRIFFSPNKSFGLPWPPRDHSVGVAKVDGETIIRHVERYSPASESGLRVGDRLVKIDGQLVETWPLGKVRERLREAAIDLSLVVHRAGRNLSIDLPRGRTPDAER